MSLSTDLNHCYTKVCELRKKYNDQKPQNILSQEVVSVNEVYKNATFGINKACNYVNGFTNDTLKGRSSAYTISVGKKNAPLIVSLKQLADNVYKADINGSNNIQETIQNSLSKGEDHLHFFEDTYKSTNKFIQSLEYLIKFLKNQDKLDKNLSTGKHSNVSEISSFLDADVVTSSPIKL